MNDRYDYIIAGGGCAGLSLLVHMICSGRFSGEKILLVEKADKKENDRTWCFWEKEAGLFESVVHARWHQLRISSHHYNSSSSIDPYTYKMIRGLDFYNYCRDLIASQANITTMKGIVESIDNNEQGATAVIGGKKYFGRYLFNSILLDKPVLKPKQFYLRIERR